MFNYLSNCWAVFQSGYIILISKSNYESSSFCTFSPKLVTFFLFFFFKSSNPDEDIIVDLLCIHLMANDVEPIFMCSLAICKFSLKVYLFRFFVCFLNWYSLLFIIELHMSFMYCRMGLSIQSQNFPHSKEILRNEYHLDWDCRVFKGSESKKLKYSSHGEFFGTTWNYSYEL